MSPFIVNLVQFLRFRKRKQVYNEISTPMEAGLSFRHLQIHYENDFEDDVTEVYRNCERLCDNFSLMKTSLFDEIIGSENSGSTEVYIYDGTLTQTMTYSLLDILNFFDSSCISISSFLNDIISLHQITYSEDSNNETLLENNATASSLEKRWNFKFQKVRMRNFFVNSPVFLDFIKRMLSPSDNNNVGYNDGIIIVYISIALTSLSFVLVFLALVVIFCCLELKYKTFFVLVTQFFPKYVCHRIFEEELNGTDEILKKVYVESCQDFREGKSKAPGLPRCMNKSFFFCSCIVFTAVTLSYFFIILIVWQIYVRNSDKSELTNTCGAIFPTFHELFFYAAEYGVQSNLIAEEEELDWGNFGMESYFEASELLNELDFRLNEFQGLYDRLKDGLTTSVHLERYRDYPSRSQCTAEERRNINNNNYNLDGFCINTDANANNIIACLSTNEKVEMLSSIIRQFTSNPNNNISSHHIPYFSDCINNNKINETVHEYIMVLEVLRDTMLVDLNIFLNGFFEANVSELWSMFQVFIILTISWIPFLFFSTICFQKKVSLVSSQLKKVKKLFLFFTKKELEEHKIERVMSEIHSIVIRSYITCVTQKINRIIHFRRRKRNDFLVRQDDDDENAKLLDYKISSERHPVIRLVHEIHDYIILIFHRKTLRIVYYNLNTKKKFGDLEKEYIAKLGDIFPPQSLSVITSFLSSFSLLLPNNNNNNNNNNNPSKKQRQSSFDFVKSTSENLKTVTGLFFQVTIVRGERDCLLIMRDVEFERNARRLLESEKETSDFLLDNIFPKSISQKMKEESKKRSANHSQVHNNNDIIQSQFEADNDFIKKKFLFPTFKTITMRHDDVTCFFCDLVGFTSFASTKEPEVIITMLDDLIGRLDNLSLKFCIEKIKTIGDCWFGCCGVPEYVSQHTLKTFKFAVEVFVCLDENNEEYFTNFKLRVGIHTGSVVSGVIGTRKYQYDVFGDTVNIAARMEQTGAPDCIQVSRNSYTYLHDLSGFHFQEREVDVKGKGRMKTYLYRVKDNKNEAIEKTEIDDDDDEDVELKKKGILTPIMTPIRKNKRKELENVFGDKN